MAVFLFLLLLFQLLLKLVACMLWVSSASPAAEADYNTGEAHVNDGADDVHLDDAPRGKNAVNIDFVEYSVSCKVHDAEEYPRVFDKGFSA